MRAPQNPIIHSEKETKVFLRMSEREENCDSGLGFSGGCTVRNLVIGFGS